MNRIFPYLITSMLVLFIAAGSGGCNNSSPEMAKLKEMQSEEFPYIVKNKEGGYAVRVSANEYYDSQNKRKISYRYIGDRRHQHYYFGHTYMLPIDSVQYKIDERIDLCWYRNAGDTTYDGHPSSEFIFSTIEEANKAINGYNIRKAEEKFVNDSIISRRDSIRGYSDSIFKVRHTYEKIKL